MSKFFYSKLAAVNIRKNGRIYLPYILTCIFSVAMFYIMLFISLNKGLSQMPGSQALITIMWMGVVVIGLFSVIILLYTNSFLMKRRKKELGLYNILGMGKNHLARVMAIESVYVSVGTILTGLFAGILLSKLLLMLLLKLLSFEVPFGFEVSPVAVIVTVIVFAAIFFVTLLCNLGRVHLSKPIELLYGGNVGEKEPKTKWVLAILGFLALGTGYTIAIVTEKPTEALGLFFIAVLLVILGTYFLFTAGSIALLKALRRNKAYYYKTSHFTAVSGMLYRMKQNAVGLATICILSTMVLVMLSTTFSMYIGMEDALRGRFPRNIEIKAQETSETDGAAIRTVVEAALTDSGIDTRNATEYRYMSYPLRVSGTEITAIGGNADDTDKAMVYFIPLVYYNKIQNASEALDDHELFVFSPQFNYAEQSVDLGSIAYSVKSTLDSLNVASDYEIKYTRSLFLILPDEQAIREAFLGILGADTGERNGMSYYFGFDTVASDETQIAFSDSLRQLFGDFKNEKGKELPVYVISAISNKADFLSVYGGLFFLGLFLGTLFIMATVIIMYYKQISEGYDDKKRFEIMQKVGLGRHEIKKTIRSQVLTVFFLPLLASGIHILAAFKMITKLLFMLNLTNVPLFAWCTLGTIVVFAAVYGAVYTLTARAYYKIVS
jgi:putative ABC transport system permease protein